MKKRELTSEEKAECAALKAIYMAKRAQLKLTQEDIANEIGISQGAVSMYFSGRNAINLEFALKIAKLLQCRVEDFSPRLASELGASGSAVFKRDPNLKPVVGFRRLEPNTGPAPENRGNIPLISWVQAGSFQEATEAYAPGMAEAYLPCPTPHGPWTFALRVRGQSMFNPNSPRSFHEGEIIYCDPDREADNGSLVVVKLIEEQEATFKQLVVEGSRRYLKALNPQWPEPYIEIDGEAEIVGVVIGKYVTF
jgi:SOS-response transcriptional repressor LexA